MSEKDLTIIDADSIAYFCGHHETIDKAIVAVDARINNIITATNADYISLFISKGKYFRHDIFPDYKGNRKQAPPIWMRSIKSYLEDKYEANWMLKAEADDTVNYWMNQEFYYGTFSYVMNATSGGELDMGICLKSNSFLETIEVPNVNVTMAAIDKDLLKSIEGKHYNYTFKPTDEARAKKKANPEYKVMESEIIKGWIEETDKTYADNFIWLQMLMGDTSDGVVGIPKIGPVKAEKYMQEQPGVLTPDEWVLRKYTQYFGITNGIYEFQKNYRLLHMLSNDEDFMREIGQVPPMPTIIDVKSLTIEPETKKVEF